MAHYLYISSIDAAVPLRGFFTRVDGTTPWATGRNYDGITVFGRPWGGGTTWTDQDVPPMTAIGDTIDQLWFSDTDLWVITDQAYVVQRSGTTWGIVAGFPDYPNLETYAITGTSSTDVTVARIGAVVNSTTVWTYHWNGSAWSGPTAHTFGTFQGGVTKMFTDPTGVIRKVGERAICDLTNDIVEYSQVGLFLNDIWMASGSTGWAVTGPGLSTAHASADILTGGPGGWARVSPEPSYPDNTNDHVRFFGVDGTSTSNVWAVGFYNPPTSGYLYYQNLAVQWDGSSWTVHFIGSLISSSGGHFTQLNDVKVLSSTDVWAVGYTQSGFGSSHQKPSAWHWDGSAWTDYSPP